jgi:repressor of nif and glnA expression
MIEKVEKKRLAILRVLSEAVRPLTGARITQELAVTGLDVSERTVRFYLKETDQAGLTAGRGKRGRVITDLGRQELAASRVFEKVGFLSSKIDTMTYLMDFDLTTRRGTVVVNATVVDPHRLLAAAPMICRVFEEGYAMGRLVTLFAAGERVGEVKVPPGMIGIGTVCSITLNGVLLQFSIPTTSRFGGLLEIADKKPVRFVEIINYDGTSIDPLEVFIRSGMTDYHGAVTTGSGKIGASFLVRELAGRLEEAGLGGFMRIGGRGQPLLEIPVGEGRVGAIVIGGLNPVAILEETGNRVYSRALAGLVDFDRLFPFEQLPDRIRDLVG